MAENHLKSFVCNNCRAFHAPGSTLYTCPDCGANLDARYCYDQIAQELTADRLAINPDRSLWRYAPFFPNSLDKSPVDLPVGMTALTRAQRLGAQLGLDNLWIKNETLNPSGSFKDRAGLMVLAHCQENSIPVVSGASTGNAGTSMACLAAASGLKAVIFVPKTAPRAKIAQLLVYGARVFPVKGSYSQAFDLCETVSASMGWFNRNTGTNPYTREGKKTVSFEIWEQMGYCCPDAVAVAVGDGNIISGIYKGFYDLKQAGLITRIPKIIGIQSEKSDAIARAFFNDGRIRRITAATRADSIAADYPSDGYAALAAVQNSGGTFVTLSDALILAGIKTLAQTQGIFAEPSGAAPVPGIKALADRGFIRPSDRVVLVVTGNGLKDVDAAFEVVNMPETVDPDPDQVLNMLKGE